MRFMLGSTWTVVNTGGHTHYWSRGITRNGRRVHEYQHRVIMEARLGRPLMRNELVHHIDGNGLNNKLANLEVVSSVVHKALHTMSPAEYRLVCEAARLTGLKPGAFVVAASETAATEVVREAIAEMLGQRAAL